MDKHKTPMKKLSSHHFKEAANKLLSNPDIVPVAKFIAALTMPPENSNTQEDDTIRTHRINLFRFCVATFPGCLSLKLLRVYASKEPRVMDEIRESAIKFLYHILFEEEASLSLTVIQELSPILITCLEEQAVSVSCFNILYHLVNRIAYEIFTVHEATWNDLRDYISSRAEAEFAKSVFVFQILSTPLDGEEFIVPAMENLVPAILKRLRSEEETREWGLAFVGGFCASIHLLETTRVDLVENLVYEMLNSLNKGMKLGFLGKALKEVEIIVMKQLCWYCSTELRFVSDLIRRIDAITEEKTVEIVLQRMKMVIEKNITFKSDEEIDNGEEDY